MKTVTISRRWMVVALVAFLSVAVSGAALAAEFAADETYRIAEGEIVDDDLYITATEIYIDGAVKGDLFAAAQYIEIGPTGAVEGDLWAAAASIVIQGAVQDDLRAAGNGIELSGAVGDDAFLAAGGGPADFPTGTGPQTIPPGVRVTGEIGGDAYVAAGCTVTLDSQVAGLHGGTGQSFDWNIAAELACNGRSFLLAGGLTPDNVAAAVSQVNPWGVDVSSGVETDGEKDAAKIHQFVANARRAG